MRFHVEKPHLLVVALLLVSLIIIHDVYSQVVPPLPGEFTIEKFSGWGDASASARLVINNVTMFPLRFNISGSNQPVFDFSNVEPSTVISFNQTKSSQGSGVWNIYTVDSIAAVKSGPATYSYFSANKTLRIVWTGNGTVVIEFFKVTKSLSDTITSTVSVASLQALFRALSETIQSIAEITVVAITQITTTVTKFFIYFMEGITTTDSLSALQKLSRSMSESITSTVSLTSIPNYIRSLSESLTNSDSLTRMITTYRSLSESITSSEGFAIQTIGIALSKIFIYFQEIITTNESISISQNLLRSILESITNSVTITYTRGFFASISDTITISNTVSAFSSLMRSISESLTSQIQLTVTNTNIIQTVISNPGVLITPPKQFTFSCTAIRCLYLNTLYFGERKDYSIALTWYDVRKSITVTDLTFLLDIKLPSNETGWIRHTLKLPILLIPDNSTATLEVPLKFDYTSVTNVTEGNIQIIAIAYDDQGQARNADAKIHLVIDPNPNSTVIAIGAFVIVVVAIFGYLYWRKR